MALPPLPIWKDTFRANARIAEYQFDPDIIGLANGNFLVVWTDRNDDAADGQGSDIVGQVYDPFGSKIGGTLFLNDNFGSVQNEAQPKVTPMADGGFIAIYSSPDNSGALEQDVLFRRFDADGNPTGVQGFVINDAPGGVRSKVHELVTRPDGSVVVVYSTVNGSTQTVDFKVIAANGSVSAATNLRSDFGGTDDPDDPALVVLEDGRVVTVFEESDGPGIGVEYRIINTDNSLGIIPNVNTTYPATDPEVAALADGGFVVVWQASITEIKGRIYDSNGTATTGEIDLAVSPDDTKSAPNVIGLREGGFALAWIDYTDKEISVRVFDETGAKASIKTDLPFPRFDATELEMSLTDDGRILLAWTEYTSDAYTNSEIFSAILDPRDGSFTAAPGGTTVARDAGGLIIGTNSADTIIGWDGADRFKGNGGADDLYGESGKDSIAGGKGADFLYGGTFGDILKGDKDSDRLYGGSGHDTMEGGDGGDSLYGSTGDDKLYGGDAGDRIRGQSDDDTAWGDSGFDTLYGGSGRDKLYGGTFGDTLWGDSGADTLYGNSGKDSLYGGTSTDRLFGGTSNDRMWGDSGADRMFGGSGNDKMIAGTGHDRVYGGSGDDKLRGNEGNDIIDGGGGFDILIGDAGADVFVYEKVSDSRNTAATRDLIQDFEHGVDLLDLSGIDANTRRSGNQAFDFIGTDSFDDAGDLRIFVKSRDFYIQGDVDGDGKADLSIKLESPGVMDRDDFIL